MTIADFLRARYQETRKQEEGVRSMRGNLGIQWEYRYDMDEEYVLINEHQRLGVNEFWEQYGEPAADPTVLADLDAKLALVDDLLAERHEPQAPLLSLIRELRQQHGVPNIPHASLISREGAETRVKQLLDFDGQ